MPEILRFLSLTLLIFFVSIALLNCNAAAKNAQNKKTFESVVRSKLGEKYKVEYNVTKTYALCMQQSEMDHNSRIFNYVVLRISDNVIINEGVFQRGYVKWHDDKSIEVLSSSSVRDDDASGRKKIIKIKSDQR
jgi:hypothetical protein